MEAFIVDFVFASEFSALNSIVTGKRGKRILPKRQYDNMQI